MPALRGAFREVGLPRTVLLTPAAGAALALILIALAAEQEGPVKVRFMEPATPGFILGETRITVEATTSPEARIVRVEIHADDLLLTVLESRPYTVVWNAGTNFTQRILRAVATDSLGRTGQATLVARPLNVGQYEEVRLVNVYATVRDPKGNPVLDLKQDDFILLEDGAPQTISHFSPAKQAITIALLVDASNSMNLGGKLQLARKAAEDFVDSVARDDRLMVLHFNDALFGLNKPESDRKRLKEAIGAIEARGGTALYDAVYRTADGLAAVEGRRAIVLLSDGRDQALTENEPGSLHLFEEALEKAHRSEVAIYAIGLGRHLEGEMDLRGEHSLKEILDSLARQTGGRSYYPERAGQLSGAYRSIALELRSQYSLAYAPTNRARDGRWRSISLRVKAPNLEVQARSGYYGPAAAAP